MSVSRYAEPPPLRLRCKLNWLAGPKLAASACGVSLIARLRFSSARQTGAAIFAFAVLQAKAGLPTAARMPKVGLPTIARSDERRLVPVVRLELTRLFMVPGF